MKKANIEKQYMVITALIFDDREGGGGYCNLKYRECWFKTDGWIDLNTSD